LSIVVQVESQSDEKINKNEQELSKKKKTSKERTLLNVKVINQQNINEIQPHAHA
jgi:hypothetical protein